MATEQPEIRRVAIGEGIYLLVSQPEPAAADAPADAQPAPAPVRAWTVGSLTLVVAAGAAALGLVRFGLTAHGVLAAGLLAVLVALSSIDIQARVLPNRIVYPAMAAVLAWQLAFFPAHAAEWVLAALGAGVFLLVPALIRPGAMGMGDVKLAMLLGAALGRDVLGALMIGSLGMIPVTLWLLIHRRGVRGATVPFGPFLAFGAAVALLV
jgi:leader peptidase (prepilin peptidase)/N-methyltransferase